MHKTVADEVKSSLTDDDSSKEIMGSSDTVVGPFSDADISSSCTMHFLLLMQSSSRFANTKSDPLIVYVAKLLSLTFQYNSSFIRVAPNVSRTHVWHDAIPSRPSLTCTFSVPVCRPLDT